MLCQFSFWNYKSYRDEVTLDLCPARITEHDDHLIIEPITGEKFLPLAVIYGPNGGGKTAVINSFRYLRARVLDKHGLNKDVEEGANDDNYKQISFMFDKQYSELSTGWSVSLIAAGHEYKYSLALVKNKVSAESLYVKYLDTGKFEMLFEREQENIEFGGELTESQAHKVSAKLPLLSFISRLYDYEHISNIMSWFKGVTVIDYGGIVAERFISFPDKNDNKHLQADFYKLLHAMGIPINNLHIHKDSDGKIQNIFSVYSYLGEDIRIEFHQESSGTQKVFSLLSRIMESILNGQPIFIDELDAKLHPKLLEVIASLFTNRETNRRGAQLIITSHDLHILNNNFLRRDEIWFAAKRDDFSSHLYSLSDFKKLSNNGKKTRKDENYAKQYLEGRYGADPYFQRIKNWTVEHEQ